MTLRRGTTALLLALALGFEGCSSTNIAELVTAMGKDHNAVRIEVRTIYGSIIVERNVGGVAAPATPQLSPATPQLSLPIQVVPQVQVGQPVIVPGWEPIRK